MSHLETVKGTNTTHVIRKLRGFNLPFLRSTNTIKKFEFEVIEKELNEIEASINDFRKHLKKQHKKYLEQSNKD